MIATTIEQSKRLLEAGIDPQTADMSWSNVIVKEKAVPLLFAGDAAPASMPAWSLSAIITLLPEHIFWRIARLRGKDIEGIFEDCVYYFARRTKDETQQQTI